MHVRADTANAMKMLSPEGVLIWHDYNVQHRDIYRFLNELARRHSLLHVRETRMVIMMKAAQNEFRRTPFSS